jgi:fluoride exporter
LTALLVVVGAAIGAPLRYLTDLVVRSWHDTVFPWGTFTVNVVGSGLLGIVGAAVAGGAPAWLFTLVGTGFCGALTTFSTFGFESLRLIEEGAVLDGLANVAASLTVGLLACAVGWAVTAAVI